MERQPRSQKACFSPEVAFSSPEAPDNHGVSKLLVSVLTSSALGRQSHRGQQLTKESQRPPRDTQDRRAPLCPEKRCQV